MEKTRKIQIVYEMRALQTFVSIAQLTPWEA